MANNNKHTGPNVPALRFPEFSGEWECKSLGEIGESLIGLTYSPSDVVKEGGTIVFRSSNIQDGVIDYGDLVRVSKKIKDSIITRDGDLLICARNGSTRLIGKNALLKKSDEGQTFGAFMMVFRSIDNRFVHQLLSTKAYSTQVSENLGARINQITTRNFAEYTFGMPQTSEEKEKIGTFLELINDRIETQSKIIEEQETLLKSLADRMFSENQYSCGLSELVDIVKGKQVNADTLSEEGDYYVMNGGVAPSGYYSEYNVPAGSISISEGGNSCGYVQFNEKPFWSGGHCYSLRAKSDIVDYKYLYYFLKAKQSDVMALRIGSGLPNIQKKDIEKFTVSFPSMVQQLRYVKVLDAVSDQLDAEKSILVLYHKQKEHLLSEMFI